MPFHVYILQSDKDQSLYIGHTADLTERLIRHNEGRSQFTKSRRPWQLVYSEGYDTRASAVQREKKLKSLHRKDLLLELIASSG